MERRISEDCYPKPACPGNSPVNNNNDNHVKIEIDNHECCCIPECPCEAEDLIKNGGFEILSADRNQVFADWRALNQVSATISIGPPLPLANIVYQGMRSAFFQSTTSPLTIHSISLQQNVTVTPGCVYQLSFAENFLAEGTDAGLTPSLIGRVFYTDSAGSQFDLINISIAKNDQSGNINKGYTFHQKAADLPIPCDVSKVSVQFDFSVRDSGGTLWALDGVCLRAVSSASSCSKDRCASSMDICETGDLIKNGGFEDIFETQGSPFLYWRQIPVTGNQAVVIANFGVVYEGTTAAMFRSDGTANIVFKSVSLRQIVSVTPGCTLEFSFAENFLSRGDSAGNTPRLIARVFYVDDAGNAFDLINIPIAKIDGVNDVDKGYTFHKRTADVPVPCNVSSVYAQFDFSVTDTGTTQWLLDAVQLRAVSLASACCQDFKGVTKHGKL